MFIQNLDHESTGSVSTKHELLPYSIKDIVSMERKLLIKNKFEIVSHGKSEKLYIMLKKTQFEQDGQTSTMI